MKLYHKKVNCIFLGTIVLLTMLIILFPKVIERFENLPYGKYPCTSSVPLLYDSYPLQKPAQLSPLGSDSIWTDYPILPSSYKQITNNKKYWNIPENGQCTPAEFCHTMYVNKQPIAENPPPMLNWNEIPRVNYYLSHTSNQ
jgi:hypothetical protein